VIVTDEAFDELLDRVQSIEDAARRRGDDGAAFEDAESEEAEQRRLEFALAVDGAVKKVVAKKDGRLGYTQTLRRHRCRLHFVRSAGEIHLVACVALDDCDEGDAHHST
jgi:hypothetical protein